MVGRPLLERTHRGLAPPHVPRPKVHRSPRRVGVGSPARRVPALRTLRRRGVRTGPGRAVRVAGPDVRRRLPAVPGPAGIHGRADDPAGRGRDLAARPAVPRRRVPGLPHQPEGRLQEVRPGELLGRGHQRRPGSPPRRCARSGAPQPPTARWPGRWPRRTPTAASPTTCTAPRTRTPPRSCCWAATRPAVRRTACSGAACPPPTSSSRCRSAVPGSRPTTTAGSPSRTTAPVSWTATPRRCRRRSRCPAPGCRWRPAR